MKNSYWIKAIALTLYFFIFSATAELVVIVNASNTMPSIGKSELTRLYMGRSSSLNAVNQVYSTPAYNQFCEKFLGKDAVKMKAYWSKQMFMGKGTPPTAYGSDSEVLKFVKENANAIGYINKASVSDGVKVITVDN